MASRIPVFLLQISTTSKINSKKYSKSAQEDITQKSAKKVLNLLHDLLLAADGEPGCQVMLTFQNGWLWHNCGCDTIVNVTRTNMLCVELKRNPNLRSKESVSALHRLIADSIALLQAL